MKDNSFQSIIMKLQHFWSDQGCIILQPLDMEVGAGTFHPATVLRALGKNSWNAAYVQPCRRPTDGRYGLNPNRLQHYYQFQTVLKPSPENIQQLYLDSLNEKEQSAYNFEKSKPNILIKNFGELEQLSNKLIEDNLVLPAYEQCIKASHIFNLIDASGVIGVNERADYIGRVRAMVKACADLYLNSMDEKS